MPEYSINDLGFDDFLDRSSLSDVEQFDSNMQSTFDESSSSIDASGGILGGYSGGLADLTDGLTAPQTIQSGGMSAALTQTIGSVLKFGKTKFDNTENGYILGVDTDNLGKFYIGNTTSYLNWTGTALNIAGAISASTIDIGGSDATSFHVDADGNMWLGAATFAASTAKISNAGVMTIASITATGTINATGGYIGSTTALVYEAQGINTGVTGHIRGGQTDYNTGTGYFLGYSGAAYKFSIGDGGTSQYLTWDGTTMTVNGRDFLTSTVFGDGSDGNVTISGDTSLSRDMYYNNLTVDATKTLSPNGFRIFVKGTLTVNGTIQRNGTAGSAGGNGSGANGGSAGAPGTALGTTGTLCGSVIGGTSSAGGNGGSDNSGSASAAANNGNNQTVALGSNGVVGTRGGNGGDGTGVFTGGIANATVGTGGTVTAANSRPFSATTGIMMIETGSSIAIFQTSASAGGSTGGGGGGAKAGGGGVGGGGGGAGGDGSPAGILMISAKTIVVSATGSITANGGRGGDGGNGANGSGNGGGGGGGGAAGSGGNGGNVVLIYQSYTNNGTVSASAGVAGTGGTKGTQIGGCSDGVDGANGTTGLAGTVTTIQDS